MLAEGRRNTTPTTATSSKKTTTTTKTHRGAHSKRTPTSANNNNNNISTSSNTAAATTTTTTTSVSTNRATVGLDAHSSSEDSYAAGGGFISDMDEHDTAFDGAMEYEEEDGRGLLGDDFDAGSDAAEVQESKKERRRREFQERLLKLEVEFEDNKQTIFAYQMARYKEEMDAVLNGVHPDFHDQLEDLAEARDMTIANAQLYRDYQFECAQHAYELETDNAEEEYQAEREGLREKMLAVIDGKRRALRDDKENLDITNDFTLEPTARAHHTRKLRRRGQEAEAGAKSTKRNKAAQPPATKWLAPDTDAMDDLNLIRKVMTTGTVKKSGTVKKK